MGVCITVNLKKFKRWRLKRWEKTRGKGKFRFVLINGVIVGGCLLSIVALISSGGYRDPASGDISIFNILAALLLFSIFGYFCGLGFWKQNESEYLLRKDELIKSEDKYNNKE